MESRGFSLLEVLMAITVMVIIGGAAIPLAQGSVDRSRASGAANYLAGRLATARFEAVRRSAHVAIRFAAESDGYWLQTFVDGNRNGVLTRDIASGIDRPITTSEQLESHFSGVVFGILPGVAGFDSGPFNVSDPIQIGSSTLLSFNPTGLSTSGTLFVHGRRGSQFAVRVLGATGRTRILEFKFGTGTWTTR